MTYCGKKFGVRIAGKLTWFASQAEAQKVEDEILWGAHFRAIAAGKKVMLPLHVAKRFAKTLVDASDTPTEGARTDQSRGTN